MRRLCPVNVAPLLSLLDSLSWPRSSVSPYDGSYGMISWSHVPEPLQHEIDGVASVVREALPGMRGATFLARLIPGQRVPRHTDAEDDGCPVRIHVPLVTNEAAVFEEAGETRHLPVGWAYLIDPTKEHSAFNGGTTDRIHLLFNVVGGKG